MSPIKTAVLGTGMSAFIFHYPFLETLPEKYEIYAAWERRATPEHSKARSAYPNIKVYTQLNDLLADSNVELVVVSLPPDAHVAAVTAALNAGKHVICEKPFTPTYEEAKQLFELAKSKNLLLAIYQNRRWDGDFLTAKSVIDSGRLGDVVEFESHIDRFRLFRKGNWKDVPSPGSGLVYDLGAHLIDQAVYLFGVPESVTGKVLCQRQIPPLEVEDNFTIVLHYPAKEGKLPIEVILRSSSVSCGVSFRYCIKGTRGTFLKFGSDPQESQLNKGMKPSEGGYGQESSENYAKLWTVPIDADVKALPDPALSTVPTTTGNYRALYEEVYHTLSGKSSAISVLPEQVLTVEKIIEAAYKSSKTSSSVKIA
ncbi:oxidoreductase involved in NADPH regeneration [Schizosaccharomyces osmophilus]|uniref:Oxidoreductase involved in NADPH regeneration n=1 Tax=Schizosaccharomyces osmophilus TaxID=2545709 RepID=A0AAE9WE96_9SCHI|nr:oxidoreductase involved in NADPH regeneration [Schizosaccharomyces osmophilus]WBW74737.1 oxidoreductase involved in NADPH regeneration [Schizosaccharomyces osmophilus]